MNIIKIKILNYRNLDEVTFFLHPYINFLVGENDLGKSNFLDMLDVIFNKRMFNEEDFLSKEKPIEIYITLKLNDVEKGIFEDLFDPQDNNLINILIKQESPEENIRYFHVESEQEIPYSDFRCANFVKYDSLRSPKDELTFYRGRGVGKFLNYLVEKFFRNMRQDIPDIEDFIKKDQIDQIVNYINKKLEKLRTFKEFGITVSIEGEVKSLIYRLLTMKDLKGLGVQKMGYGVQFLILVILSILEKIMHLLEDRRRQKCIYFLNEEGNIKNCISLILGLDEPEIHLHPYMQRSLIKYINNILLNKNNEFSSLLKELFNIDEIFGQAIIVTHSPNILLDDYKQIVRFYLSQDASIKVKSGVNISLDPKMEKHLLMNLPYVKEAFFSKSVIIVEGETEFGSLPIWGEKMLGDMDEYGISVIKAGGKYSIKPLVELLNNFDIKTVSIRDRDDGVDVEGYDFITDGKDFEEDLVTYLFSRNKKDILFDILAELGKFDPKSKEFVLKKGLIEKEKTIETLRKTKSVITGRIVGKIVDEEFILEKFKNAIKKAKEYVTQN